MNKRITSAKKAFYLVYLKKSVNDKLLTIGKQINNSQIFTFDITKK